MILPLEQPDMVTDAMITTVYTAGLFFLSRALAKVIIWAFFVRSSP